MQIYSVNNSPNFGAKIKINKNVSNQICDKSNTSSLFGSVGTVYSSMVSETISSDKSNTSSLFGSVGTVYSSMVSESISGFIIEKSKNFTSKFYKTYDKTKRFVKSLISG